MANFALAAWKSAPLSRTMGRYPAPADLSQQHDLWQGPWKNAKVTEFVFQEISVAGYTVRGFHPVQDVSKGNPAGVRGAWSDHVDAPVMFLDKNRRSATNRIQFGLQFVYEVVEEFLLGDEVVCLPVVKYIWRTDPALTVLDVIQYTEKRQVPTRYQYDYANGRPGHLSTPFNISNFERMMSRFVSFRDRGVNNRWPRPCLIPFNNRSFNINERLSLINVRVVDESSGRRLPMEEFWVSLEHFVKGRMHPAHVYGVPPPPLEEILRLVETDFMRLRRLWYPWVDDRVRALYSFYSA